MLNRIPKNLDKNTPRWVEMPFKSIISSIICSSGKMVGLNAIFSLGTTTGQEKKKTLDSKFT